MSIDLQNSASSARRDHLTYGRTSTQHHTSEQAQPVLSSRLQSLEEASPSARLQVDHLLNIAKRGLPRMYRDGAFGHTLRAVKTPTGWTERLEGDSLRYLSMVALGLSHADEGTQRQVLDNATAADLARTAAIRAETSADAGAIALAAWAAAEAGHFYAEELFRKLGERLASDASTATVDCAWALIAALAGLQYGDSSNVIELATDMLVAGQSTSGLFPHVLPASAAGRLRSHIGSFADQVYPIQALSRLHRVVGDIEALWMAQACARRICALQGPEGQWWWHYDAREGRVAEGYPVYSVHQHAMAPMALLDLLDAGGDDHLPEIIRGLGWLTDHPEVVETLVDPEKGVIWRKVARREPRKIVRAVAAVSTALAPGRRVPGIDLLFPPVRVDYECRPYELGWLLYAWLAGGATDKSAIANHEGLASFSREV